MRRKAKGSFGYTDFHKKQQLLKTGIFFLLPAAIFLAGYLTTKTKENYFTIIAVVGSLPACKELVNVILFWKRRSMPRELYEEISAHAGELVTAYELVLTTYEKSYPITAIAIAGNEAAGYTQGPADLDWRKAEAHIQTILKHNGISKIHVQIFRDLPKFLRRVDELAAEDREEQPFSLDERYPGLSRDQVIREVILALSL